MADSPAFQYVCEYLETASDLDRLESRGTVRLALKNAGLAASDVTAQQMTVVLEKVLPAELAARGIADADSLISEAKSRLSTLDSGSEQNSPEAVFARLGG